MGRSPLYPDDKNILYFGDNIHALRRIPTESVDLVYLDPPFNSRQSYNVICRTHEIYYRITFLFEKISFYSYN